MTDNGEKVREVTGEACIRVRLEQYTPLISWFPCPNLNIETAARTKGWARYKNSGFKAFFGGGPCP
ncbi:MAG: hypothetical protein JRJ03_19405 [Deltaproteobacteria bacterium]|nr:hypothetical protein [Deltaproteobacteria bacterium]